MCLILGMEENTSAANLQSQEKVNARQKGINLALAIIFEENRLVFLFFFYYKSIYRVSWIPGSSITFKEYLKRSYELGGRDKCE